MKNIRRINLSMLIWLVPVLTIATVCFWLLPQKINVYRFAMVGALFELAWLPMILLLFGLPVVSVWCWRKQGFGIRSFYLYFFILQTVFVFFLFRLP